MPSPQMKPPGSPGLGQIVLRTDPRWFLTRGFIWGLLFPLLLRVLHIGAYGLPCALGMILLWLLFRNSRITIDSKGFTYHAVIRQISHSWVDIDRFCVVEQRVFAVIPISLYLGWFFSPAYKHYKLLAVPRTMARWVGTSDAMFKPLGFNVRALTALMNDYLRQSRVPTDPASAPDSA